jgi:hypothetical protein
VPQPFDVGPRWGEVGIHGLHRFREWDAVATVVAPELPGSAACFVVLPGGRALVEEGEPGFEPSALASAVGLEPPFRVEARRRAGQVWALGARRIEVVSLATDPGGSKVEVVDSGDELAVRIDDEPVIARLPELERLGHERYGTYVVAAERLEGPLWEVIISPL